MYEFRKYKKYMYGTYAFMFLTLIFFLLWKKALFLSFALGLALVGSFFQCLALYQLLRIEECIEELIRTILLLLLFICLSIHLFL